MARKEDADATPTSNPAGTDAAPSDSHLADYISGIRVRATPEEREAVQVFARRLVEDYEYEKSQIQTRPQFRVRKRPSDDEKSYPVDIAVFPNARRVEAEVFIIVECKKPTRIEGIAQLKLYLDMSAAEVGVWFNGHAHAYLRKVVYKDGRREYKELPNIPRRGQRIEDIGLYQRKDLKPPSNLKAVFKDIRNHLAGSATGLTRDEALAQQLTNVLFCKIYDEINTLPTDVVTFRSGVGESPEDVKRRLVTLFEKVKAEYSDVFEGSDRIELDDDSLAYVVGELQTYSVTEADRDAVGDAFEVFIGPALRGAEGQFFTPRNVVQMVIEILDPKPGEMIVDPACGSGGFLIVALASVWRQIDNEGRMKGWSDSQTAIRKKDVATKYFRGLDKDSFLAKVTKAYMALVGDGRGGVFCENSLKAPSEWAADALKAIKLGGFDVVMTNPPFGKKIRIKDSSILLQYDLGHQWKKDKSSGDFVQLSQLRDDQPPQILFLERCLQLLKPGGRLGIVLPEAIFGMPTHEYVVAYLLGRAKIFGIVSMPEALFKTSGKGGTHAKVCVAFIENTPPKPGESYDIFMAEAKWCGHDSRGNRTIRKNASGQEELLDDVPKIASRYKEIATKH